MKSGWPLVVLAIMALAVGVLPPLRAAFYANLGAVGQTRAELSLYEWPTYPIQDAVRREIDLSAPVAQYEQALASDPRNATANRRLGMIELSLGEYEPALAHLTKAYAAEPGNQTTRQLLGEALIVNGEVDEGAALWSTVDNAQGQLAARQWWYEHIGEAQRAEWMRQASSP